MEYITTALTSWGNVEINLNCSLDVRSNFLAAANLRLKPASMAMSSAWALEEGYMPGGTAMVAHGNVCGRIHQKGADTLGRFTWMALRGRSGTGVIIVTAYRVCQTAGTDAGDNTAYMREYTSMREAGIEKPDPRNSILDDISDLLLEWGQKGHHPLVLMDANLTMDETNMAEFMKRHGLHDLVSDLHPGDPPPTYGRGSSRIDLTLGDAHVRRAVSKCGALAMHEGVSPSDHTMQFIDFDEKWLFGNDSFKPMAGFAREFRLYDTKKKEKFQEKLDEIYKHQRIPDRVKSLAAALEVAESITPELIKSYQKLDSEIVEAILAAAAATGRKDFGYQRSPALGKAFNQAIFDMANEIEYDLPAQESIGIKTTFTNVTEPWKAKGAIEVEDAQHRADWLEELADAKAKSTGGETDKVLKQMIKAAKQKRMFQRMRAIFKPEWSALDYIEVPTSTWYLTEDKSAELYQFDDRIFLSHGSGGDEFIFESYCNEKVPPKKLYEVTVKVLEEMISVDNLDSM
jgi:hypothetical protein